MCEAVSNKQKNNFVPGEKWEKSRGGMGEEKRRKCAKTPGGAVKEQEKSLERVAEDRGN